jgi:hypothetical protein
MTYIPGWVFSTTGRLYCTVLEYEFTEHYSQYNVPGTKRPHVPMFLFYHNVFMETPTLPVLVLLPVVWYYHTYPLIVMHLARIQYQVQYLHNSTPTGVEAYAMAGEKGRPFDVKLEPPFTRHLRSNRFKRPLRTFLRYDLLYLHFICTQRCVISNNTFPLKKA